MLYRVCMGARPDTGTEAGTAALGYLRRELARGTTELAVLSVLNVGKRYGYALLKALQAAGPSVLDVKEGTLYPLLHRLEDAGWITGEWQAEGRRRPRKYYVITDDGRERLTLLRSEWANLVQGMQQLLRTLDEVDHER